MGLRQQIYGISAGTAHRTSPHGLGPRTGQSGYCNKHGFCRCFRYSATPAPYILSIEYFVLSIVCVLTVFLLAFVNFSSFCLFLPTEKINLRTPMWYPLTECLIETKFLAVMWLETERDKTEKRVWSSHHVWIHQNPEYLDHINKAFHPNSPRSRPRSSLRVRHST